MISPLIEFFSVQPLCSQCLCGVVLLGIHQPQRHRGHRGCTEKSAIETFCAKPSRRVRGTQVYISVPQWVRESQ